MLEKPDLDDQAIIDCLRADFGVNVAQLAFLPLGADVNTAVYRAVAADATPYFVKLRRNVFDATSVLLPRWLSDQGVAQIIPPLPTATGTFWAQVGAFTVVLYPFVEGQDGYAVEMTEQMWREFGAALRRIHTADVPAEIADRIHVEDFTAHWRESVRSFLARVETEAFDEPVAAQTATLVQTHRAAILDLVARTERLAAILRAEPRPNLVCHSDLHAGNMLIDGSRLFIVDWDAPIRAPKERDLMYPGGGQGFRGHTLREEEALFYAGYGPVNIDPVALAYYRYERIVQDIAAYCEELLLMGVGGEDRAQSLRYLASNFEPAGTIAIAYAADSNGWEE